MDHAFIRTFAQGAAAAVLAASAAALLGAQQTSSGSVFTAGQAATGKAAYAKSCASCHMPDMSGNNEIPPLAGTAFMSTWEARSTKQLFDYISASMPYSAPSLTPELYTAIVAYILEFNGGAAGGDAFTTMTAVPIAAVTQSQNRR